MCNISEKYKTLIFWVPCFSEPPNNKHYRANVSTYGVFNHGCIQVLASPAARLMSDGSRGNTPNNQSHPTFDGLLTPAKFA